MDQLLSSYSDADESRESSNESMPPLKRIKINATPDVPDVLLKSTDLYIPNGKELAYNVPADTLYRPREGPTFPHQPNALSFEKNCWTGVVEASYQSDQTFDQEYNTFYRYGYAHNPSKPLYNPDGSQNFVGDQQRAVENRGATVLDRNASEKKKKRKASGDPSSANYLGPWAPYEDDITNVSDEEEEIVEPVVVKRTQEDEETPVEEKTAEEIQQEQEEAEKEEAEKAAMERTTLHVKERYDYQGRTYLSAPSTLRVTEDHDCFLPKKRIHTWTGHTKAISAIKLFPRTGHLLLSAGLDAKVKIWSVYDKRPVLRTCVGHTRGIKDVAFSADGTKFVTASLDRYVKVWDTESGQVIGRFQQEQTPLCCEFYPEDDNVFLAGCYDKQIVQWDCRTKEIELNYNRHLGPINSITFVDNNRRFVSTSDDKAIKVWDFNTPVEIKTISEPYMHSMPRVARSHGKSKWLACQSMDNQILIYSANDRFKINRKKQFKGHIVAGYACQPSFSADNKYLASGDSTGHLYVWDWKSQGIYKKLKAHDGVCISALWHPVEASKVITAGWDGRIHLWD